MILSQLDIEENLLFTRILKDSLLEYKNSDLVCKFKEIKSLLDKYRLKKLYKDKSMKSAFSFLTFSQ